MPDHDEPFERARAATRKARASLAAHEEDLDARNRAVNDALAQAPVEMSDNEVARQLDLEPSTFRSIITDEVRRARRAARRSR